MVCTVAGHTIRYKNGNLFVRNLSLSQNSAGRQNLAIRQALQTKLIPGGKNTRNKFIRIRLNCLKPSPISPESALGFWLITVPPSGCSQFIKMDTIERGCCQTRVKRKKPGLYCNIIMSLLTEVSDNIDARFFINCMMPVNALSSARFV